MERKRLEIPEITYREVGGYPLPNFFIHEGEELDPDRSIGKYGQMRKKYLQEYHEEYYENLLLTGKLMNHLVEVQEETTEKIERLIEAMLKCDPAPDKETDHMGWVRYMNTLHMLAESSVIREIVYD
jgi:hypothetical protein